MDRCMNIKQIAVLILLIGCVVFPLGIIILFIELIYEGYDNSILKKLLKELE